MISMRAKLNVMAATLSAAILSLFFGVAPASPAALRPFTVRDGVELRTVLGSLRYHKTPVLYSPNGRRFAVLFQRGDLQRNGNWVEVLAGTTDSLEAAAQASIVAKLFTTSAKDDRIGLISPTAASWNRAVWLDDNERLVFLWNDGKSPTQVIALNVRTGRMEQLTHHPTSVLRFSVSGDGRELAYVAFPAVSAAKSRLLHRTGFTVPTPTVFSMLSEHLDGRDPWFHAGLYLSSRSAAKPREVSFGAAFGLRWPWPSAFSPDGRYVLCQVSVKAPPSQWQKYTDPELRRNLAVYVGDNPDESSQVQQLMLIDVQHGSARPLLDAPSLRPVTMWSPDGGSVVVGSTFLPVDDAGGGGLTGTALAEIDVSSGAYAEIPLPEGWPGKFVPLSWTKDGLTLASGSTRLLYRKTGGGWQLQERQADAQSTAYTKVRIEMREGENLPQALYAVDTASGSGRLVFELNPLLLSTVTLGRVEMVEWTDPAARKWRGRLYYPVGYTAGRRYPMVIQTHGYAEAGEFSTSGLSYDGPLFSAQALANRGLFVVQVQDNLEALASPREPEIHMAGYEAAAAHFERAGLIDGNRIGIAGYSRSGWYVEYLLTHSSLPIAAAEVADNMDGSYVQAVLNGGARRREFDDDVGAASYSGGLQTWLEHSPGFNSDRIHTPLRLEVDAGGTLFSLAQWEMFSNLRYQKKPVELFIIPDAEQADHPTQMPAQRFASQESAVDWFDFWLNGHEDPAAEKRQQYAGWHELRAQKEQDSRELHARAGEHP
jgi:hypothetical protein